MKKTVGVALAIFWVFLTGVSSAIVVLLVIPIHYVAVKFGIIHHSLPQKKCNDEW